MLAILGTVLVLALAIVLAGILAYLIIMPFVWLFQLELMRPIIEAFQNLLAPVAAFAAGVRNTAEDGLRKEFEIHSPSLCGTERCPGCRGAAKSKSKKVKQEEENREQPQ